MSDPLADEVPRPWRVVASRVVYRNPWSEVIEDDLRGPADEAGLYGYFAAKPYAIVCALDAEGHVHLVRQWRHAFGCATWELPCGAIEDAETPRAAAERELAEEAGVRAATWHAFPTMAASDARVAGRGHPFLARDLAPALGHAREASEGDLVSRRVPLTAALAACDDGRIHACATVALLYRVARWLER